MEDYETDRVADCKAEFLARERFKPPPRLRDQVEYFAGRCWELRCEVDLLDAVVKRLRRDKHKLKADLGRARRERDQLAQFVASRTEAG